MQKTLLFKSLIVLALMGLIAVPLMMIQSTISDRMRFRDEAVRSIAADSVGEQTLLGPVLVIPYTETFEEKVTEPVTQKVSTQLQTLQKRLYVYPNDLKLNGSIETDHRYRGIHKVLIYSGQHALSGDFSLPGLDALTRDRAGSVIAAGTPFISLGLSDTRGLKNFPKIVWNGKPFEFKQGSKLRSYPSGLHAPLDAFEFATGTTVKFNLDLAIEGIEGMAFIPVAKNNQVTLKSKWPHPQFGGRFLPSPKDRSITADGFNASWSISSIASQAQQQLITLESDSAKTADTMRTSLAGSRHIGSDVYAMDNIDSLNLSFIEPVNNYSQADRAVKYGMLFIALTFAAFFLFELLKQLPIHPVQYALVGLALAIFFLLLVSLSEHMRFLSAYLIASGACIVLIGFYLAHALRSWLRGMGFGAALTLLYGVLFGLLQSENNALVLGSLLLFAVLAAIMVVTRKVDWYQLGKVG